MQAFVPELTSANQVACQNISVTNTSQAVSTSYISLRFHNVGTTTIFVNFGTSIVTATVNDIPFPAGQCEILRLPRGCTHIAVICATTGNLHITGGNGL
jgi:hypothetical protein